MTFALAATMTTAAQAGTGGADTRDWPSYRAGPANSGFVAGEQALRPTTVGRLRLAWKRRLPRVTYSSPVVANGVVYAGVDDGTLHAFRTATGRAMWAVKPGANGVSSVSTPAVWRGRVIVGGPEGSVYAVAARSGRVLWTFTTGGSSVYSPPTVAGGIVYVEVDGAVSALRGTDGKRLWSTMVWSSYSAPAVARGFVYVPGASAERTPPQTLVALRSTDGAVQWSSFAMANWSTSSAAVWRELVFLGSSGDINAYRARGCGARLCRPVWTAKTGGWVASPAVAHGRVFVSSDKLYSFDARRGKLLWQAATGAGGSGHSPPAVAGGVVFVGSEDGRLFAFRAAGCGAAVCRPLWTATLAPPDSAVFAPAVAAGTVYATTYRGFLYAFRIPGS